MEPAVKLRETILHFGTASDIECGVSIGMHDDSSSVDPLVAQGVNRFERVACLPLAGSRPAARGGGHLETLGQVVSNTFNNIASSMSAAS